jgi:hypothetical protein
VIEMRRPESGDRLIIFVAGAWHDLIEILVLDPAAVCRIESQDLRAGGLGIVKLRIFPIADSRIQASVHEEQEASLRASEWNDRRIVESDRERLIPREAAGHWVHDQTR